MKAKPDEFIATHRDPLLRTSSNYVFHAHIGVKDGRNEWEQLWGRTVAPGRVVLCCIPFFLYDIALGDEVLLTADSVLSEVLNRSGQLTFRVWFGAQDKINRKEALREIESLGAQMEWSSENLLAISVPESGAKRLADVLEGLEQRGLLQYETGQTIS